MLDAESFPSFRAIARPIARRSFSIAERFGYFVPMASASWTRERPARARYARTSFHALKQRPSRVRKPTARQKIETAICAAFCSSEERPRINAAAAAFSRTGLSAYASEFPCCGMRFYDLAKSNKGAMSPASAARRAER